MRLSLDSLVLLRAVEVTKVAPLAAATVAATVEAEEEATELLHQVEDDRFSSTMFVLPSTYLSQ